MKMAISAVFGAFAALAAMGTSASAEVQYPWCAEYRKPLDATNCGFVNYQQCRETVFGIGGYCYPNPAYHLPRERSRRR
jgi:hypothetical protein